MAVESEKVLELFDVESSITSDASHRECINWIVARNRHNSNAVRHHNVLTLAHDAKTDLLQSPDRIQMIDPRESLAQLKSHPYFANIFTADEVVDRSEILTNGILDVFERLLLGCALGPATG